MVVRGSALLVNGQDFKVITRCHTESSEGVCLFCGIGHSQSIFPHLKPDDSISVVDPVRCRIAPGESDGGGSAG